MAQPAQVFQGSIATIDYEYSVIDNSSSPSFPTLNAGAHIGYDTICQSVGSNSAGANSQFKNAFTNGTVPDFVVNGQTKVLTNPLSATIVFKNPS